MVINISKPNHFICSFCKNPIIHKRGEKAYTIIERETKYLLLGDVYHFCNWDCLLGWVKDNEGEIK